MTDRERPNLSLGEPPGRLKQGLGGGAGHWPMVILLLQLALLVGVAVLLTRPAAPPASSTAPVAKAPDLLRATAMGLEERGLDGEAARAWLDYLEAAGSGDTETGESAQILYRAGKLFVQAERFGEAAATLVRAELAAKDDKELKAKIGPKLIECLRRLGRYGEVGRELARQVKTGGEETDRGKVLAAMAGETITEADLDRLVERRVDNMLEMQGGSHDATARETILRQFSSPQVRQQLLQEILQTEVFCRRAREVGLDQREEYVKAREQLEESFLARRFLAQQLETIRPTDVDLQSYYEAHRKQYEEPDSIRVLSVRLAAEEDPAAVLAGIQSADDFRKLAAGRDAAQGAAETETGEAPPAQRLVRGRADPVLGDPRPLFDLGEGEWTKTPHAVGDDKYLVLVEKKDPARTPAFEEVRARVATDYTARKQQELSERLLGDLMTRYDVRIVPPPEPEKKPAESPAP
jgi:peptidyl-prolyl cis-trans isomerase C